MKLISEAKQAWRMFSVQANTLNIAILGAWQVMPDDLKMELPKGIIYYISMSLLAAGIGGRLVKQDSIQP
jgi:hypothetical protein